MLDEMTSIEASGTWELVDLPQRVKPIGLKWVYKTKKDAAGIVTKHKARLVAKGYVQRQGIDYDEVFAPVARLESVCLLLAHAACEGWAVHHMDVKSAFLTRCSASSRLCTDCAKLPRLVLQARRVPDRSRVQEERVRARCLSTWLWFTPAGGWGLRR